jgi:hypothetical protein
VKQSNQYHYLDNQFYYRTNGGKMPLKGKNLEDYLIRNPR